MSRPPLSRRLAAFGTTIFAEMTARAARVRAVNLGQGFPDYGPPPEVLAALHEAISAGHNQYPPGVGVPELRGAIVRHQARFYGLELDPDLEVLVTTGATEAVAAAILALCTSGDEVIAFEPFYDSYAATVELAGAVLRPVRLSGPDWTFEEGELASAFNERTRVVLVNTPHNPTGKVFSPTELGSIASLCAEHDVWAVTDDVYEHLVFDGVHLPLTTLPGMAERTVTISSAGKTFSATGWKIGWATGPGELVRALRIVKQFLTYASGTPFQYAVATGLDLPTEWYRASALALRRRRDLFCSGLEAAGLEVLPTAATYFATVDVRSVGYDDGVAFCEDLIERHGVAAIPTEVFYSDRRASRPYVRFAFCKSDDVLVEAVERLSRLAPS